MESDAVRTVGDEAVVQMWVSGQFRSVSVPRSAIIAFLRLTPDRAVMMTDEEVRDFLRRNLRLVAAAAADALRDMHPNAPSVTLDAELLRKHGGEPGVELRRAAGR